MPSWKRTDLVDFKVGILGSEGGHLDFQVRGTDAGIWKSEREMVVISESLWPSRGQRKRPGRVCLELRPSQNALVTVAF